MAFRRAETDRVRGIRVGFRSVLPRNSVRRVAVVFILLLAVLLPLMSSTLGWSGWTKITGATAAAGGACARAVGIEASVSGNLIRLPSRMLSVDPQCTGYTLMAVYIALVLAYPVSVRMRLLAIVAGLPVLLAANVARLVGVAFASEVLPDKPFYLVHDYLMEFAMVFVVLMIWAVWLSFARKAS